MAVAGQSRVSKVRRIMLKVAWSAERRPTHYYVHTIPGLEGIAREELEEHVEGLTLEGFKAYLLAMGLCSFRRPPEASSLLRLRIAEDVFVVLARVPDVPTGSVRASTICSVRWKPSWR